MGKNKKETPMNDKASSQPSKSFVPKQGERLPNTSAASLIQTNKEKQAELKPVIVRIDEKIQQLKKKKERIQTQQALMVMKEAQHIFTNDFAPSLVLTILSDTWGKASERQKEEWRKRATSFQAFPFHGTRKKAPTLNSAHQQS